MNIVDYVIIGIIGISVLFGLYRGFIASVLNMGCGLMSFLASFWVSPKLAAAVQSNQSLINILLHYTDASSRIGDLETAIMNVATLTSQTINSILEKVNLPAPLDTLLRVNLENNVYATSGLSTVSDYVSQTILQASINIICFLVSFLALYIILSIVLNLLKAVFRFPVLKQLNGLAGGAFGFLRGLLVCLVLFTLVPLVQTVVPLDMVNDLIAESTLAPIFSNGNLILAIMHGKLYIFLRKKETKRARRTSNVENAGRFRAWATSSVAAVTPSPKEKARMGARTPKPSPLGKVSQADEFILPHSP